MQSTIPLPPVIQIKIVNYIIEIALNFKNLYFAEFNFVNTFKECHMVTFML